MPKLQGGIPKEFKDKDFNEFFGTRKRAWPSAVRWNTVPKFPHHAHNSGMKTLQELEEDQAKMDQAFIDVDDGKEDETGDGEEDKTGDGEEDETASVVITDEPRSTTHRDPGWYRDPEVLDKADRIGLVFPTQTEIASIVNVNTPIKLRDQEYKEWVEEWNEYMALVRSIMDMPTRSEKDLNLARGRHSKFYNYRKKELLERKQQLNQRPVQLIPIQTTRVALENLSSSHLLHTFF